MGRHAVRGLRRKDGSVPPGGRILPGAFTSRRPQRGGAAATRSLRGSSEEHLRYTVDGQVVAVAGSRKGKVSIDVFNLRRSRLKTKRRNKVAAVVDFLQLIREQEAKGNAEAARDLREFLNKWFLTDSCEHAAMARAVVRDPALFGL